MFKLDISGHRFGSPVGDWLYGYDTPVTFHHSAGDDHYIGGLGYDTLTYAGASGGVAVDVDSGTTRFIGTQEIDRFSSIEKFVGSQYNDYFWAGANSEIDGGAGDDWIVSGAGANTLSGGADVDTISYTDSTGAVHIELAHYAPYSIIPTVVATGGWAEGDVLSGFENIRGSNFDDFLSGDSGVNKIEGNGGDDIVHGFYGDDSLFGDEGDDALFGGDGNDLLHGGQDDDVLFGEDNDDLLFGDDNNDNLWGGAGNDYLDGGGDADTLHGGAGADTMVGGAGVDKLYGDSGADMFLFMNNGESGAGINAIDDRADWIMDFNRAQGDKINLAYIDANQQLGGHQEFTGILHSDNPSMDSSFTAGTIAYSFIDGNTAVQINLYDYQDANGYDAPEMTIMLAGQHDLSLDDFIVSF